MPNYMITRLSCWAVCQYFFITGACLGGMGGLVLGLMERHIISVLGGMFLGLLVGVAFAVTGLVFAVTYNLLAPMAGGIAVQLEPVPVTPVKQAAENTGEQQSLFPGE